MGSFRPFFPLRFLRRGLFSTSWWIQRIYIHPTHTHTHSYVAILSLSFTCGFVDRHQSSSATRRRFFFFFLHPSGVFYPFFFFLFFASPSTIRQVLSHAQWRPNSSPGDRKTRTLQRALALALGGFSPARTPGTRFLFFHAPSSKWSFFFICDDVNVFILFIFYFSFGWWVVCSPPTSPPLPSCPPAATKNHHKWNSSGLRLECVTEKHNLSFYQRIFIYFFSFFFFFLHFFFIGVECFFRIAGPRVSSYFSVFHSDLFWDCVTLSEFFGLLSRYPRIPRLKRARFSLFVLFCFFTQSILPSRRPDSKIFHFPF